jgi:Cu-Zn family superoxide dismutase
MILHRKGSRGRTAELLSNAASERRQTKCNGGIGDMKAVALLVLITGSILTAGSLKGAQAAPAGMGMTTQDLLAAYTWAVAVLQPAAGGSVSGSVAFTQLGGQVTIVCDVHGLEPNSSHGIHIHETGDCSAPDFSSAGGHFNPDQHAHGAPNAPEHHAGDLGNLEACNNGRAYKRMVVNDLTLDTGPHGILNRSVILHAQLDDLTTQPSGNSGGRIACGVIKPGFPDWVK